MDVTCERCSTEYEFDETLVAARGTTVKCTNCGNLFKVFRPGTAASASTAEPRIWTIRRDRDATVEHLSSLKELQRLITTGRLCPEDEISRSGGGWKRLGDIAELQTFFTAVRPAPRATMAGHGPLTSTPPPSSREPTGSHGKPLHDARAYAPTLEAPEPGPQSQPPPRSGKATILGLGHATPKSTEDLRGRTIEAVVPPPATPPPGAATPAPRPLSIPKTQMDLGHAKSSETPRARPAPSDSPPHSPRLRASVRPLHVDEEDEFRTRQRGRSWSGVWVAAVVLLAGGLGLAQGWDRITEGFTQGSTNDPVSPFLRAGQDALRLDHHEAYRNAATHFTKALAFDEHDARALSGLSRAHALIAQQRLFEAADLEARSDPAERATASALREQAAEHADQAREHAEAAIRHGTGDGDVEIALSDALRLSRDYEMAESRLARGRTLARMPSAEASRVEALIAADRGENLALAKPAAERAVAQDPGLIRARLLLARAELASGNVVGAQAQLRAVLDRVSDHPIALSMQHAIARREASAPAAATEPPGAQAPPAPRPEAAGTREPAPEATPRGYDALIREGEQRLENGDLRRARALFEQALRERANGPEGLTGLGFVMLAEGNARGAVTQLERAVERGSFDALIGLGDAFRRLDDRERALRAYQRYLEHTSSGPRASIARRQVERLSAALGTNTRTPDPPPDDSASAPRSDTTDETP